MELKKICSFILSVKYFVQIIYKNRKKVDWEKKINRRIKNVNDKKRKDDYTSSINNFRRVKQMRKIEIIEVPIRVPKVAISSKIKRVRIAPRTNSHNFLFYQNIEIILIY